MEGKAAQVQPLKEFSTVSAERQFFAYTGRRRPCKWKPAFLSDINVTLKTKDDMIFASAPVFDVLCNPNTNFCKKVP